MKSRKSTLKRLYEPIQLIPKNFHHIIIQSWIWALFEVYTILIISRITSIIQQWSDITKILNYAVIFLVSLIIFQSVKYCMRHRWRWESSAILSMKMRDIYFPKYIKKSISHVEKMWTGRTISILKDGISSWEAMILNVWYMFPSLLIKCTFAIYLVAQIWWIYAVIFIGCLIFLYSATAYIDRFAIKRRKQRKEWGVTLDRQLTRMIMSKQEIMQSDKTNFELSVVQKMSTEMNKANLKVNQNLWIMFNIPTVLMWSLTAVTFFYVYTSMKNWSFSLSFFVSLTALIGYLTASIMAFAEIFKTTTQGLIHIQKMRDFFDNMPDMANFAHGHKFQCGIWKISCTQVSFSYDTESVFTDFTLNITWGKKTALVGMSWSGKSTLMKMIAGYITPDSGEIIVDNQNLATIALQSYYPHVWYLTQEPSIFDGSIYENLVYALKKPPSETELARAIEQAQCQFIYEFHDWVQTEIGEKGIRLSWGQRQRLAIAKIFLKNPEIVLLDEPTSALDSFSEEKISQALQALFMHRTVVIIAHRLQTVKEADDIIVLEGGIIVERGSHDTLVALGWQYAKMLQLQSWF